MTLNVEDQCSVYDISRARFSSSLRGRNTEGNCKNSEEDAVISSLDR
jgi:hypothetical protein